MSWSAPPIPSLSVASAQGAWRAGEELMVDVGVILWGGWLKGVWFHQGRPVLIEWSGNRSRGVLQKHCRAPRGCCNGNYPSWDLKTWERELRLWILTDGLWVLTLPLNAECFRGSDLLLLSLSFLVLKWEHYLSSGLFWRLKEAINWESSNSGSNFNNWRCLPRALCWVSQLK